MEKKKLHELNESYKNKKIHENKLNFTKNNKITFVPSPYQTLS
jgi:hypothetical protein